MLILKSDSLYMKTAATIFSYSKMGSVSDEAHRVLLTNGSEQRRNACDSTRLIVQELCESRGGRPGLSGVLTSLLVSVDVKLY